jgi:hypothetical protein
MAPNLIATLCIVSSVCLNLDRTAVLRQQKVMRGFQMVEPHVLIATHVHLVHLLLRHLLRVDEQRGGQGNYK